MLVQVGVDATFFAERDTLSVRTDLADAEVYICAPEVLLLYADNFDFQHMRRDFITGVLSEEELGNKLYVYELEAEYAMRVHNFRTYDAVTRDVLLRWVHPLVPDSNLLPALLVRCPPNRSVFVLLFGCEKTNVFQISCNLLPTIYLAVFSAPALATFEVSLQLANVMDTVHGILVIVYSAVVDCHGTSA